MLDDHCGPRLVSIQILSDAPLKIKMVKELRKTTNKNKIISIKNGILNDFLSGIVVKRLI